MFDNRNNFEAKVIQDEVDGLITIENYDLRQEGVEYVTLKITVPHDR